MSANMNDILVSLLSAAGGGGMLKLMEGWINRSRLKNEQGKQFRDELRSEAMELRVQIDALRAEIKEKEAELDQWREKFWALFTKHKMFVIEVHQILLSHNIDPSTILSKETSITDLPGM